MSHNTLRFSDKENALKQSLANNSKSNVLSTKSKNIPNNAENAINIRSNAKQANSVTGQRNHIQRVPLGGKDQNKAIPSLQRSQSSLHDNKQQRKKILLPKAPSLSKANSSLGFIHRSNRVQNDPLEKREQKDKLTNINSSIFNPDNAQRSKTLVQPHDTDSLVKHDLDNLNAFVSSPLNTTITPHTKQLDASNIPRRDLNRGNVDPIKRDFKQQRKKDDVLESKPDFKKLFEIHEDLIENEDSIEYVPHQEPQIPYHPHDVEPLDETDLEVFTKPNRITLTKDNEHEYSEILKNEMDLNFEEINLDDPRNFSFNYDENEIDAYNKEEIPDTDEVGLNANELDELLDF